MFVKWSNDSIMPSPQRMKQSLNFLESILNNLHNEFLKLSIQIVLFEIPDVTTFQLNCACAAIYIIFGCVSLSLPSSDKMKMSTENM